jgi:hypothetical protein
MVEFVFDTTRAVVDLLLNGTVARHPDIAFIIPHAGAALPAIVDRVAAFSAVLTDVPRRRPPTPRRRSPPTSAAAATPASSRWGAISRRSSWLPEEQPDGHLRNRFGPHNPDDTDVEQGFAEQLVDLGEVAAVGASATGRAWSPPPPRCCRDGWPAPGAPAEPPQNLKEYDPEWGRAFWTGSVAASCDHDRMLRSVRVPVLFTHHFRAVDPASGLLIGAATDGQAEAARNRLAEAGVPVDHRSYETTGHSMHGDDPRLFVDTLLDWTAALPSAPTLR